MKSAVLLVAVAACNAGSGTLDLDLATAPGSDLIANIGRLRLTLTNPAAVFEATRTADGIDLAFELEAVDSNGVMFVEAFDANGSLLAVGQSPPFPLAGTDSRVVIYIAPPYSIQPGPANLASARSRVAGTPAVFGAVLAGGVEPSGAPSVVLTTYNAYDHTFTPGADLPVPRANVTLAANDTGGIYVFGGTDATAAATSNLYRFQSNIAPRGVYSDLGVHPGLESSGQIAVKLGPDLFFVTGPTPALISASTIEPIAELANVPAAATAARTLADSPLAAFVGDAAVGTFDADRTIGTIPLPTTDSGRAIIAGTERGTALVVGGSTRDAIVVTFADGTTTTRTNALSVARRSPTVAATSRHILVAHGLDENGAIIASADILDATTFELLSTQPLDARTRTVAVPMTNDQILIAGGEHADGDLPTGLVELFTPPIDPALP